MTSKFNLSEWALRHRSMIWYFMIVGMVAGALSFYNLGRAEDPDFTIKTMLISASWPGATTEETINEVTDRIEKKLEDIEDFDYTKSITTPGHTTVYLNLKATTDPKTLTAKWKRVRNLISDIKSDLPAGVVGPTFNDDFGDVFGMIYAFTSDGLSKRKLRDYVEYARTRLLAVPGAGKINIVSAQDEVIYLEFSTRRLAALGLTEQQVVERLQAQNEITPSGTIEGDGERVSIRVSGSFTSEDSLRAINLNINNRFFRLDDVATITRGYVDPPTTLFRFNGQPAIGLSVGMAKGGNITEFGTALEAEMDKVVAELPIGVGVHMVSNQADLVVDAVGGFIKALIEAVVIVLIVSFISLGVRPGLVVAITIPLVLALTFVVMDVYGVGLQRISLGALIIALGLLVDDAMIAIEMMVSRLELGDSLHKAATYVYTSTAWPMLSGTLVTIASFMPVAFNSSSAGEFTFTLFVVIAAALIISWVVAVLFAPLLGVALLPKTIKSHHEGPGRFGRMFGTILLFCMQWKWVTIIVTLILFVSAVGGMRFVEQQFFPASDRDELLVDWTIRQNASIYETLEQIKRFEETALKGDDDIDHWSTYIGRGTERFLLSVDVQPASANFGQIIIVAKDIEARNRLRTKLAAIVTEDFVGTDAYVHLLEIGPPIGRPVLYRISGPDIQAVRRLAQKVAGIIGSDPETGEPVYDWNEPSRVLRVNVRQDKAAKLGVTSESIAVALNSVVGGAVATQVRDDIYLINVVWRADDADRASIETLQNLQLSNSNGAPIPLSAVADISYESEAPTIWRRNRLPTITVKASIIGSTQPATIVSRLAPEITKLNDSLPSGFHIETGGAVEESAKGQGPIIAVVPMMLMAIATIIMIQMQSFQRAFLVVLVAPLGLIGVVTALVSSGAPLGFVAILGILALIGILIRNSLILVVQIEDLRKSGMDPWNAVIEATEHRMRPIMLTAAAASLALIPIAREIFWGPMAYAMMGGIIVGTVLTLLFLPALYIAWFKIKPPATNNTA
jgi:multidrug efflux pump